MYILKDLYDMTPSELQKELLAARRELFELRFTVRMGKEKNTAQVRKHQKYVAQILTVLNFKLQHPETVVESKPTKKSALKAKPTTKKAKK